MAAYISFQPSDFFSTKLYTGTGSSNAITGLGFQPDFTWIKNRSAADNHLLFDAVRGVTKFIPSNLTTGETTNAESLKTFDSYGFTVGTYGDVNTNTENFASWNWKAGTTTGIAGSPSITPTAYSFNTTSGCSILTYTGTGATATLPHGLGVAPDLIMTKELDTGGNDWGVYHQAMGNTKKLSLNTTGAVGISSTYWNDTSPTSTLFTVSTNTQSNGSGTDYVAYYFVGKKGYSKFGSYIGNQNTDGTFVYTGFRPAYLMIRQQNPSGGESWFISDDKRQGFNPMNDHFYADDAAIGNTTGSFVDLLSNGFKLRTTSSSWNSSTNPMLYWAFAEFPLVSSNSKAGTAR